MRFFHPDGPLYSWKTLQGNKKGRLDHLLVTPRLLEHITKANYVYLGKEISDHSSTTFTIDLEKHEQGKGMFRANPSLLNHSNYITLIKNVIYSVILDAIKLDVPNIFIDANHKFLEMITLQEELLGVEMLKSGKGWQVTNRIEELNTLLMEKKAEMYTIDDLLGQPLNTDLPTLLESVMCSVRSHTISYQGTVKALRQNKKLEIKKKLEELNSILDDGNNEEEIEILETQLKDMTDEMLQEQGSFYKSHELLNDCRITKEFLRLESRKGGYNHVIKLNSRDSNGNITDTITDPENIRKKMKSTFQAIFDEQKVDTSETAIEDFLLLDSDNEPLAELDKRKIPENIKMEMEGKLKDDELNKALLTDMKPNSAPGIDGFTVKFIRAFWDHLRPILREAVNNMKEKGKMSATLRTAIMKLLLKSGKDRWLLLPHQLAQCSLQNS